MLHDQVAILLPVHCASSARRGDFLHVGHVLWARRWGELLGQQFLVQERAATAAMSPIIRLSVLNATEANRSMLTFVRR